MIRNPKIPPIAAMALAVFGAVSAGPAHAAEEKFHCSVGPCTITASQDGAAGSATGSQVFIPKNSKGETGSYKCGTVSGSAISTASTTEELTVGGAGVFALAYGSCKVNGSFEVKVRTNECAFVFTSKNGGSTEGGPVHVECPTAKHIEIEVPEIGCIEEVTPQTLTGVHYHNIGTGVTTETTVEAKLTGIDVEVAKTPCLPAANVGDHLTATYTGNALATAEKDNSNKEMVEGWWGETAIRSGEEFHCQATVAPCTVTASQDGAAGSVTGSQVFIPKNNAGESASFKCGTMSGGATSTTVTTPELTVGAAGELTSGSCKVNGSSEVKLRMNECHLLFTAANGGTVAGAVVHILCPTAKHIERVIPETGCVLETTPQTLTGVHYHNIGIGSATEITVEMKLSGLAVEVAKTGTGCLPKAVVGETLTATYNGNLLFTAEKDNSNKEMVEGWWA